MDGWITYSYVCMIAMLYCMSPSWDRIAFPHPHPAQESQHKYHSYKLIHAHTKILKCWSEPVGCTGRPACLFSTKRIPSSEMVVIGIAEGSVFDGNTKIQGGNTHENERCENKRSHKDIDLLSWGITVIGGGVTSNTMSSWKDSILLLSHTTPPLTVTAPPLIKF